MHTIKSTQLVTILGKILDVEDLNRDNQIEAYNSNGQISTTLEARGKHHEQLRLVQVTQFERSKPTLGDLYGKPSYFNNLWDHPTVAMEILANRETGELHIYKLNAASSAERTGHKKTHTPRFVRTEISTQEFLKEKTPKLNLARALQNLYQRPAVNIETLPPKFNATNNYPDLVSEDNQSNSNKKLLEYVHNFMEAHQDDTARHLNRTSDEAKLSPAYPRFLTASLPPLKVPNT